MPIVKIELSPGRTVAQKTEFMEKVTHLTSEVLKCPIDSVDVLFVEVDGSNWAHGGKFYAPEKRSI